jgi:hypothetical protein
MHYNPLCATSAFLLTKTTSAGKPGRLIDREAGI